MRGANKTNETTTEIQNKIDKAQTPEEVHAIYANQPKTTFAVRIDEMLQAHGIEHHNSISDDVAMSRSHFNAVINGTAKPKKHHIIKIGIAAGLSVEEINELLKLAHLKELYAKEEEDAFIMFGIRQGWDIFRFQEELEKINASFSLLEK